MQSFRYRTQLLPLPGFVDVVVETVFVEVVVVGGGGGLVCDVEVEVSGDTIPTTQ